MWTVDTLSRQTSRLLRVWLYTLRAGGCGARVFLWPVWQCLEMSQMQGDSFGPRVSSGSLLCAMEHCGIIIFAVDCRTERYDIYSLHWHSVLVLISLVLCIWLFVLVIWCFLGPLCMVVCLVIWKLFLVIGIWFFILVLDIREVIPCKWYLKVIPTWYLVIERRTRASFWIQIFALQDPGENFY